MNNKGQVLVLFVLILPLLISLMCIVVSFGNQYLVKRNVDNNIKQAIKYGLKHLDDENVKSKMSYLLKENITDIDSLYIDVSNNKITVSIIVIKNNIFKMLTLKNNNEIKANYTGYIVNNNLKIIKE